MVGPVDRLILRGEGRTTPSEQAVRMNSKFHEFLQTRAPWRMARLYYIVPERLRRAALQLRYRRPPKGGWGEGWRVLVFRQSPSGRRLHVLAPVKGLEFDEDLLRLHVRGEAQPDHVHQRGVSTATMAWAGHHIYVVNEEIGAQRIPMDKLIPGLFRGGVLNVGLTLIDVRTPEQPGRTSPGGRPTVAHG